MSTTWDSFSAQFEGTEGSIDLREEFAQILTDHGYNIFLRRRLDQFCPYYDLSLKQCTKRMCEFCSGTGFVYQDYLLKTYRKLGFNLEAGPDRELWAPIGLLGPHRNVFYFEYDVKPLLTDRIIEVTLNEDGEPVLAYNIEKVFDITSVHAYREKKGRIEYYAAIADEIVTGV